jgi:hypothetical protein
VTFRAAPPLFKIALLMRSLAVVMRASRASVSDTSLILKMKIDHANARKPEGIAYTEASSHLQNP